MKAVKLAAFRGPAGEGMEQRAAAACRHTLTLLPCGRALRGGGATRTVD